MDRSATLEKLRGRDGFDDEMLEALKQHDMSVLSEIPLSRRNDRSYMGDLLFAVWNHCQSFIVYQYCGGNIQSDPVIALEVFMNEPALIQGSYFSVDERFIIQAARVCPEITAYMNPILNEDEEFIIELNKVVNSQEARVKEVFENAAEIIKRLEGEPELVNDRTFMHEAIAVNAMFVLQASAELRNNVEFLKEEARENQDVISVVAKNLEAFEFEGIKAVQETSKGLTIDDCLTLIDELIEKSDDARYEKIKSAVYDRGLEDPRVMKWVTAMVAQREDLNPQLVKKVLDYSILTMEKTKRDVDEDGRMQLTLENAQALIVPTIINRLKGSLEKQGISLENDYERAIVDYTNFYEDFNKQYRAKKKKDYADLIAKKEQEERESTQAQNEKHENDTDIILHTDVVELLQDVSQERINEATKEFIAEVEDEKKENRESIDENKITQKHNTLNEAPIDKSKVKKIEELSIENNATAVDDLQGVSVEID